MISAFIITKNEANRIGECVSALHFADEIVVVDAVSSDRTVEIARESGARAFLRPWSGYTDQRNFGIEHCKGDWIFYMDADELPGPGFGEELRRIDREGTSMDAFEVNSREQFMGRFLEHGGYGLHQPNRKVRVWRKGAVRFTGDIHERAFVVGPIGQLDSHVEHYSSASTVTGLIEQNNRYSDLEAHSRLRHGEHGSWRRLLFKPCFAFLSRYVRFSGFRDGGRGFLVAILRALYFAFVEAKMLEVASVEPAEERRDGQRETASQQRTETSQPRTERG